MIATNETRSTQDLIDRLDWLRAQRTKARSRVEVWTKRTNLMIAEIISVERALVRHGVVEAHAMLGQHILDLIAAGRTNPEIAESLGYSTDYIKNTIDALFAAAGVESRAALVAHGFRTGSLK